MRLSELMYDRLFVNLESGGLVICILVHSDDI